MSTVFDEALLEERPEIDLSTLPSLLPEKERVVVLALDIGTSGTRAALFDSRGEQIEGSLVSLPADEYAELLSGNDVNADALVTSTALRVPLAIALLALVLARGVGAGWAALVGSLLAAALPSVIVFDPKGKRTDIMGANLDRIAAALAAR